MMDDKSVFDVIKINYMRIVLNYTVQYYPSILYQPENQLLLKAWATRNLNICYFFSRKVGCFFACNVMKQFTNEAISYRFAFYYYMSTFFLIYYHLKNID